MSYFIFNIKYLLSSEELKSSLSLSFKQYLADSNEPKVALQVAEVYSLRCKDDDDDSAFKATEKKLLWKGIETGQLLATLSHGLQKDEQGGLIHPISYIVP